ncbi:hypothetical protein QYF36_026284 [Acer negundo]|nr:hypothetical protein QYF36_026284 [Acer negundo]
MEKEQVQNLHGQHRKIRNTSKLRKLIKMLIIEDEDEDLAVQPLNVDQEVIADEPKVDVGGEAQIEVDEALIIAEIEDN